MAPDIRLDKYVQRKSKKGREYFFFRKVVKDETGRSTEYRKPLPHPFEDGYRKAYEAAWFGLFGVPIEIETSGFSIADLCTRYDRHYRTSKAKELPYYKDRASTLLKEKLGIFEVADIKPIHMQKLYDTLCDKPQVANRLFDDISAILQWGIPRGFSEINPAKAIERVEAGGSYEPWPLWAIEQYVANAQWHLCRAFLIALYTGQSRKDILNMRFKDIEEGVWNTKRAKTGADIPVPLHSAILTIVADEWDWGKQQGIIDRNRPVLRNSRGKPWKSGFGASWAKELARLELDKVDPRLTFHGLRTTNATIIASAVARDPDRFGGIDRVQSLLGHHSRGMSEHYARRAKQEHMNADSIVLMPEFGNHSSKMGTDKK